MGRMGKHLAMTNHFILDWATVGFSIFNSALLLWLGLTVFLNAERRTWGVWLIEEGLLLGALFFICHTFIIAHEVSSGGMISVTNLDFFWRVGWYPVILSPFLWYTVILWYTGYWEDKDSRLHKRHRLWWMIARGGALLLIALISFAHPLPTYTQLSHLDLSVATNYHGIPLLFLIYPPFAMLCILLPIDALRRPLPSRRMMGDLARHRTRPWLIGTSLLLLLVVFSITGFVAWIIIQAQSTPSTGPFIETVVIFDLILEIIIAAAIILLGQAIVSYEVFTGKSLPRRGFLRHWRNTVILAEGIAILIGWSLTYQALPIYSLILTTLMVIIFYALFSWRSFAERESYIARLRPFVSSQNLMRQLISTEDQSISRANILFEAICQDVLNTTQAYLIPLGRLAPLVESPLIYPSTTSISPIHIRADSFPTPDTQIIALPSDEYQGLRWAIPLWAERGLIGALLLADKHEGGLYTQEEIEIAQTSAERIVDMLAGEQMARRLMTLQRRRLTETRVLDLRTRRILHDDILPTLHTAVLSLSSISRDNPAAQSAIQAMSDVHAKISDLIHTASQKSSATLNSSSLHEALKTLLNDDFSHEFSTTHYDLPPDIPTLDPLAQEIVLGAIREAIRNAAIHGRGNDPHRLLNLTLTAHCDTDLSIFISDDGVGHTYHSPNGKPNSHKPKGGSGGGLALHSTMLAIIGGYLTVDTLSSGGTQVLISIPANNFADTPLQSMSE